MGPPLELLPITARFLCRKWASDGHERLRKGPSEILSSTPFPGPSNQGIKGLGSYSSKMYHMKR